MSEGELVPMGIRLPKEFIKIIEEKAKEDRTDKSTVIRQFLAVAISEYKKAKAARLYKDGKITISTAAKMANLTVHEMVEYLVKIGFISDYAIDDFRMEIELLK
jgi:predicted HTH domain antitoxin